MNIEKLSVICDSLRDSIELYIREKPIIFEDTVEEYTYEKVMDYNEENELNLNEDEINYIVNKIMKLIDLDAINEEKEDEKYIAKYGMYHYLGLDKRDF